MPGAWNDAAPADATFDVLGLGQAMVDFGGRVLDEYLASRQVTRGGRRVITAEERSEIIAELEHKDFKLNAGGSLANTMTGVASLSKIAAQHLGVSDLKVAMAGCVGSDPLGDLFRTSISHAGVQWLSQPAEGTGTGTVVVLTTPDAQRSFLSYPGSCDINILEPSVAGAVMTSRVLVIEGFLWELPGAPAVIQSAIRLARTAGTQVVLTAADKSVVQRHRLCILQSLRAANVLFCNAAEAAELLGVPAADDGSSVSVSTAESFTRRLAALCPTVVVTNGSKGSCISSRGALHVVPPCWSESKPVDTCGAGDAFAAGFLFSHLIGLPTDMAGRFAAATASQVIAQAGPNLTEV